MRGVKRPSGEVDITGVTSAFTGDRRRRGGPAGPRRAGALRRLLGVLRDGLYRPLAEDDDRVAFWVRHVRYGILLSELCALAVGVYALVTETPGRQHPVILGMAGVVVLGSPLLLLLPLPAMMRDHRGPTMFYLWTLGTSAVILTATWIDGGASSPLDAMLFLTLTYMAAAYPPYGVVAMGSVMTAGYVVLFGTSGLTTSGAFFIAVLVAFTLICTMASANSWAAHDRQVLLISTQTTLASTDPLTGIPNRRTLVERLSGAVDAAAWGHRSVVCLVDLDGFKGVNDRDGHAAGDAMLKAVASILGGVLRETDTVARLGGDEFAVLADVTETFSAELLAERLRQAVALVGSGSGVTASIGVADVVPGEDVAELMHRADAAMYRAKADGGNRFALIAA
ncbi:GGDEF domain-containing protein [Blastococcus sp. TML/C7B]|uniref:GGDEF domain-containing protein n=1 Tax=Blastococcus sp. TML/C7B TaxID=2798728 RepID=UPI00190D67C3|nr:GGDEF domain-containing protein [Blastococcus sp. TML/C7B]MBN1097665.1 GGDEF domain-containing protein [Blastococcus sp. TML/C7B]